MPTARWPSERARSEEPGSRIPGGPAEAAMTWRCVYTLGSDRQPIGGSAAELAAAIRRGADLRIYTEFRHNEHIDTESPCPELVHEVSDFRVTYLVEDAWTA